MFKEERQTWFYFIGIVIMIALLVIFTQAIWIPIISGDEPTVLNPVQNLRDEPVFTIDVNLDYLARLETNAGSITIDLLEKNAPNNVNNFIYLSQIDYYDGTRFFRLIPNLLVQGGDRNALANDEDTTDDGFGNTGYIVEDEINFSNIGLTNTQVEFLEERGYTSNEDVISEPLTELSVAMASAGPNTNSNQFFIILAREGDSRLEEMNGRFTVIGSVISGLDVIQQFRNTQVDNPNLLSPSPIEDIIVNNIEILTR